MDTASHVMFGFSLAGFAYLDPAISQTPALAQAVLVGCVIGSNAPDFDTLIRLKGFSYYIRHHRGITHSIPAWFIIPGIITYVLSCLYHVAEYWYLLYALTFVAVLFHVWLDMLNTYGVQCFYPFTKKWIHYDVLAIFEPFLFLLHALGVAIWLMFHIAPGPVFLLVYTLTLVYIGIRVIQHKNIVRKVLEYFEEPGVCHVIPTFHWFRWQYVLETKDCFKTGTIRYQAITLEESYSIEKQNTIIQATLGTDGVRAFLSFAQMIHVTWKELQDGYEVRWSDVRFWYNRSLPFGVDVHLDRNLNVVKDTLGWRKKTWDPPFV